MNGILKLAFIGVDGFVAAYKCATNDMTTSFQGAACQKIGHETQLRIAQIAAKALIAYEDPVSFMAIRQLGEARGEAIQLKDSLVAARSSSNCNLTHWEKRAAQLSVDIDKTLHKKQRQGLRLES